MHEPLFDIIDKIRRPVSVAQIGGFRPDDDVISWFGGKFIAHPTDPWPKLNNAPSIPLLQLKCAELPFVPEFLSDIDVMQVFSAADQLPVDLPASNGEGFLIRTFSCQEVVEAPDAPSFNFLKPFQIRWHAGPLEGPTWEEAYYHVTDHLVREYVETDDPFGRFNDRYERHYTTKVGGWASYIQGIVKPEAEYVFQIGSEEKPNWMVGDNGNMYFYREDDGSWLMGWDCY